MRTRSGVTLLARAWAISVVLMSAAGGSAQDFGDPEANAELLRQAEAAARADREFREQMERRNNAERQERESAQDAARLADMQDQEGKATRTEKDLQKQMSLQDALLRQATDNTETMQSAVPIPNEIPSDSLNDPRIAAPAPRDRILPEEIFDRSEEEIAPGTWGNPEQLRVTRLTLDADGDGQPELIRFVERETELILRQESDRNYNGILDAWHLYRGGKLATRILDDNDDGNPDVFETYRDGRVSLRELDRDDDGVRDFFYRYRGDSLVEERHDANNDGVIDLVIVYENRLRVRAEEDTDRDGRMDLWTRWGTDTGTERVTRIERDTRGGGFADTFEIFESKDDKATIVRREQDLNGDGEIDAVSFYVGGKLQRRQIRDSKLTPLPSESSS